MKKFLLSCFAISTFYFSNAQGCTDVFISEYVEGWSNNKAIEIYNPTLSSIDLSTYGLVRFQNGSTSYGNISYLTGITIQSGQALVLVLDKQNQEGTGLEAPVWDDLAAAADVFVNPNYDDGVWPMYFNGNDAVAIVKNSGQVLVDLFGKIGEGTGFGGWGPNGTDASGNPLFISQDHTLKRKSSVTAGLTANPTNFDIMAQWDSLPANTFDQLGIHSCSCAVDVSEIDADQSVSVYPNPAQNNTVQIATAQGMNKIRVFDVAGKLVVDKLNVANSMSYELNVSSLENGVFIVEIELNSGKIVQKKLIK